MYDASSLRDVLAGLGGRSSKEASDASGVTGLMPAKRSSQLGAASVVSGHEDEAGAPGGNALIGAAPIDRLPNSKAMHHLLISLEAVARSIGSTTFATAMS